MDESARDRWREVNEAEDSPALYLELLRKYVRDFPENAGAWACLGKALVGFSLFDDGERAIRTSAAQCDLSAQLYRFVSLGWLFQDKGDDATAESWFRKAIDHSPDDTHGYIALGGLLGRRGRLTEAEEIHRRGAHCKTGCIDEAYFNLGLVLRGQGRYDEALPCFEEALRIDPQYKAARLAKRDVQRAINFLATRR